MYSNFSIKPYYLTAGGEVVKINSVIVVLMLFVIAGCAPQTVPPSDDGMMDDSETVDQGMPVPGSDVPEMEISDDLSEIEQELDELDEGFGSETDEALEDLSEGLDIQ